MGFSTPNVHHFLKNKALNDLFYSKFESFPFLTYCSTVTTSNARSRTSPIFLQSLFALEFVERSWGAIHQCLRIILKGLVTRAISCAISCPICCKSKMRFGVSAIWCCKRNCYRLHEACNMVLGFAIRFGAQHGIAHQIADTLNCIDLRFGAKKR
jgi:hypothetical protein